MTGSSTTATLGTSTTAAGVALLPNTNGSTTLTVISIAAITLGAVTLLSFAASRVAGKVLR